MGHALGLLLQRATGHALGLPHCVQICRHHEELVNQVANAGVLASTVQLLTDKMTSAVRQNASGLLLQVREELELRAKRVSH